MSTIPAQEIKRRGISAVDDALREGPVHVVKSNRAQYVVLSEEDYAAMVSDLTAARVAKAEEDVKAGRVHRGTADQLMREMRKDS